MQIILKPEFMERMVEELMVDEGVLVGMMGYNSFPILKVEEKEVLVGDTGAMID